MQVLSFFLVLLDLTSEAALATSFHSQLQPRLPCPSVNEFWDSKLNFCVRCRVCAVVTLRECSATSNTVCGNSYTQGVKERVKNASTSKKELFQKWKGRSSNDNRDSIVSGMIKYSEDDDVGRGRGGVTGRGHHRRRGPGNDLHSDLKAIERELLFDGSSGEIPPLESLGATDSPNIVIGKKRFYEDEPAYDGDYATSHESDDMYLDGSSSSVYGQVVVDPQQQQEQQRQQEEQSSQQKTEGSPRGPGVVMVKAGPDAADEEEKKHDEFGLLHSILQERKEKEAAAAAKAANSKTG